MNVWSVLIQFDFETIKKMVQWLGSYCNQAGTRCCYPPTGKPSPDFTIDGLWPYFNDGNFAYNCGNDNYDVAGVWFHFLAYFDTNKSGLARQIIQC